MYRRGLAEVILVLVLVASPVLGGGLHAAGGSAVGAPETGLQSAGGPASTTPVGERANQTIVIEILADGDARWTVSTFVSIDGENETAAFNEQAQRWEAGTADVGYTADTFRRFAEEASAATGRPMRIPGDSVDRSADLLDDGDRGVFRLSFTWTNFARRQGERLLVDDAFQSESGTWLPGLQESQLLVIRPPSDYTFRNAPRGANLENGTLIWRGPTEFSASYFLDEPVIFVSDGTTSTSPPPTSPPPTSPPPTDTPTVTTSVPPPDDGQRGLLFGIVGALLLGGGLALYRRYGPWRPPGGIPLIGGGTDDDETPTAQDGAMEVQSEAETAGAPEPTPEDPFAGVDEDLLADDERVHRLLQANGGRMKQADIVKETGWSNAKVSQLLSAMEEDGEVDKLRIGRENLISLPEVEVGEIE